MENATAEPAEPVADSFTTPKKNILGNDPASRKRRMASPQKKEGEHLEWVVDVLSTLDDGITHPQLKLACIHRHEVKDGVIIHNDIIAKALDIHPSTVYKYRENIRRGIQPRGPGRPATVPERIQAKIIPKLIRFRIKKERWLRTKELLKIVKDLCEKNDFEVDESKLTNDWVYNYLKRYKHLLRRRKGEIIQKKRYMAASFYNLSEFMNLIAPMMMGNEDGNLDGLYGNLDESVMSIDEKNKKVSLIGLEDEEIFYYPNDDAVGLKMAMITMITADGSASRPMMAYGTKNEPWAMKKHASCNQHDFLTTQGTSEGYQNVESLMYFFKESVVPHFERKREEANQPKDATCQGSPSASMREREREHEHVREHLLVLAQSARARVLREFLKILSNGVFDGLITIKLHTSTVETHFCS